MGECFQVERAYIQQFLELGVAFFPREIRAQVRHFQNHFAVDAFITHFPLSVDDLKQGDQETERSCGFLLELVESGLTKTPQPRFEDHQGEERRRLGGPVARLDAGAAQGVGGFPDIVHAGAQPGSFLRHVLSFRLRYWSPIRTVALIHQPSPRCSVLKCTVTSCIIQNSVWIVEHQT